MKRKSPLGVSWRAIARMAEERRAERASELERYWNESDHSGETFDPDKATALLLHNVKRYEPVLLRIAESATEQMGLMHDRLQTGQAVTDVDMARYLAFLETAQIAAEALGRPAPTTSPSIQEKVGES